jgi:hypothetical protein
MTAGHNKYAFISVEGVVSTLTQMISPVLIGFFIVSGARFGVGSVTESYQYVAILGFCILVLSGLFAIYMNIGGAELARPALVVPRSYIASTLFGMDIFNGMIDGVEAILGVLFVLIYLGQEDTVGSIQTVATIISVVVLGLTGHVVKAKHFYKIISAWGVSLVVSAWVVAIYLGPVGVLVAILIPAFMRPFRWAVLGSLLHGSIDKALRNHGGDRFSYLLQREWRLNFGRVLGAVFLLSLFLAFGQDAMLRYGYALVALAVVPLIAHVRKLVPLQ